MEKGKVVVLEDRIPKLKEQRKQKANKRLIFYISIFFLLLLGVIYFQSPLSNLSGIEVEGNRHLTDGQIIKLSGLTKGTSYWKINEESITGKLEAHEEIQKAQIEKKFPHKIILTIKENRRIAYIFDQGHYYPILQNGRVLKNYKGTVLPGDAPVLFDWKNPDEIQEMAAELVKLPEAILNSISEIHHTPEKTDPLHISLFMNDGFEVSATVTDFSKKMSYYPSIAGNLDPKVKGIIHLEVGTYFEEYKKKEAKKDESKR